MKPVPCSYILCGSKMWGIYTPIIRFWPKIKDKLNQVPPGHAVIRELRLCENCARTARVHDIVTDKRWAEIYAAVISQGGAAPDRETIQLALGKSKDLPA